MSLLRDVIKDSVIVRQSWTGETVTHLRTGLTFIAEYEELANLELNAELGRDPREAATLHVIDRTIAAKLLVNDLLAINLHGQPARFRVLSTRTDNPGSPQIDFALQKITTQDT